MKRALRFAEHCSAYIIRSALPGTVNEFIVRHINRYFERKPELPEKLASLRVTGLRLSYSAIKDNLIVQILVVCDELSFATIAAVSEIFDDWASSARENAANKRKSIRILSPKVTSMSDLRADEYIRSFPFRTNRIILQA